MTTDPYEQFAGAATDDGWIPDPPSVEVGESGPDDEPELTTAEAVEAMEDERG